MRVFVNDFPVELLPGMTVYHAILKAGLLREIEGGKKAYDEKGHELGLGGSLSGGEKIFVR